MSFWEGAFRGIDPLTLSTIVQIQLKDSQELAVSGKGKHREGTVSDQQLALQMYREDLRSTSALLEDRRMAQSMAFAIMHDSEAIQKIHRVEDQIARDRLIATSMDDTHQAPLTINPTLKLPSPEEQDAWADEEMLAKAAAIYMQEPGSSESSPPALIYDSTPMARLQSRQLSLRSAKAATSPKSDTASAASKTKSSTRSHGYHATTSTAAHASPRSSRSRYPTKPASPLAATARRSYSQKLPSFCQEILRSGTKPSTPSSTTRTRYTVTI